MRHKHTRMRHARTEATHDYTTATYCRIEDSMVSHTGIPILKIRDTMKPVVNSKREQGHRNEKNGILVVTPARATLAIPFTQVQKQIPHIRTN